LNIILSGIIKRYGRARNEKWALREIDLAIEPGVFGLLGRNGAGKTTLLQILATLLEPTSGNIRIGPYDAIHQRWQVRPLLGFLSQDQGFYPRLTVMETLQYLATLQNLEHAQQHIERALEVVNLSDRKRSYVGTLSGGMRRRLGLAQALLGDPPILIVDEPTTGLDPVEQQRFRTLIGSLGAQGNRIILLSTHIVADVATVASKLAVLEQGTLVFQGTVHSLTDMAQNRCWQWRTNITQIETMRQQKQILVTSLTPVTDNTGNPDQVIARVVGNAPSPDAIECTPTLEDGYFAIIGAGEQTI
jgi:ABC-2 type transport system ATP-binding protein